MENKLFKLLYKIRHDLSGFFNDSLNPNNEVLDRCFDKDENGKYVEDTEHWNKMLVRSKNLQMLVAKLRVRLMAVNKISDFEAARRILNDEVNLWDYGVFLSFEENCDVGDTRSKCIKIINRTYETALWLIDEAENKLKEERGEGQVQLAQLKTNLTEPQRALLFNLLVKHGFIPDNNKDCFIWAFGKPVEQQPEQWYSVKWNKSKQAFWELLKTSEYVEITDGKRVVKTIIPILGTISNQNKRDIEKLFVDEFDNPLNKLSTPKKRFIFKRL